MKKFVIKFVINFITIILLIFTSSNFIFAEKIVCKCEELSIGIDFSLSMFDDNGRELERIWGETINSDILEDEEKQLIMLTNGIEFYKQEECFEQLKGLALKLYNLVYNPSQPFDKQQVTQLHSEMFGILGQKLYELGYDL